ncbi:MAG TPA: hypothetical protein VFS40_08800 [Gemmatimonadales bacterium]|nr:hypothetical protein [Gemmatimonadales bacterium]
MRVIAASLALLVSGAVAARPATAQGGRAGTLVVQQGGREIGREEVSLRRTQGRDGVTGSTLQVTSRYPNVSPAVQITTSLDRGADGQLEKFVLEGQTAEGPARVLAAGAGARLIVKSLVQGTESGRELPGGPDVVLLDENVYALFSAVADLATPQGARLTAIYPRTGRRVLFTARRSGDQVQLSGELRGSLSVGPQGTLQRLELPATGTVVSRIER